jgi:hypothetical protein
MSHPSARNNGAHKLARSFMLAPALIARSPLAPLRPAPLLLAPLIIVACLASGAGTARSASPGRATSPADAAGSIRRGEAEGSASLVSLDDGRVFLYRTATILGYTPDRVTTILPVGESDLAGALSTAGDGLSDVPDADGLPVIHAFRSHHEARRRSIERAGPTEIELRGSHLFEEGKGVRRYSFGDVYEEGIQFRCRTGVAWRPNPQLAIAGAARAEVGRSPARVEWTRLAAALRARGVRVVAGRQPRWWGPGELHEILLTNNARAADGIEIATDGTQRLPWLGPYGLAAFLSYLDDGNRPTRYPLLFGHRVAWRPAPFVELGAERTIMLGGSNRTERLTLSNIWDIFIAHRENISGYRGYRDTDHRIGFDATLYLTPLVRRLWPAARGFRFFYRYGGDDSFEGVLPTTVVHHYGGTLLLPLARLDVEYLANNRWGLWYWNEEYPAGYTYRGAFMGSDVGWDATSLRGRLLVSLHRDLGLRIEVYRDAHGEHRMGERGYVVPRGRDYSRAVEYGIAFAHRLRHRARLVFGYRFRNPEHGFTFVRDRYYPRHTASIALRVE